MNIWPGIEASQQEKPVPTTAEMQTILKQSDTLKRSSPRVAISMRRIAIQMAAILDANAPYNTPKTMRETVQELSDRLRDAIEKYERAKNVRVMLYYKDCGADDVTDDFIESIFPYPVKE
jgi:metal-dependent amidase/aminoacylase/carboxypeptidase family protein